MSSEETEPKRGRGRPKSEIPTLYFGCRLHEDVASLLDALAKRWNCSRREAVERSILIASQLNPEESMEQITYEAQELVHLAIRAKDPSRPGVIHSQDLDKLRDWMQREKRLPVILHGAGPSFYVGSFHKEDAEAVIDKLKSIAGDKVKPS